MSDSTLMKNLGHFSVGSSLYNHLRMVHRKLARPAQNILGGSFTEINVSANNLKLIGNYYIWIADSQSSEYGLPPRTGDHLITVGQIIHNEVIQRDVIVQWNGTSSVYFGIYFRVNKGEGWTSWKEL